MREHDDLAIAQRETDLRRVCAVGGGGGARGRGWEVLRGRKTAGDGGRVVPPTYRLVNCGFKNSKFSRSAKGREGKFRGRCGKGKTTSLLY